MDNSKIVYNMVPLMYSNKILNLLSYEDIDWYINNCREHYYEEYNDFKFSKDITKNKLKSLIYSLVTSYKLKDTNKYGSRMLLKDIKTKEIYGGCVVFNVNNDEDLELAYFILPKYASSGLATEMLLNLIYALNNTKSSYKKYILRIQSSNIASINVAEKCGFTERCKVKGKYTTNIIYELERK